VVPHFFGQYDSPSNLAESQYPQRGPREGTGAFVCARKVSQGLLSSVQDKKDKRSEFDVHFRMKIDGRIQLHAIAREFVTRDHMDFKPILVNPTVGYGMSELLNSGISQDPSRIPQY